MADSAERVVVEIIGKTDGFEASVNRAAATNKRAMSEIEADATKAEGAIRGKSAQMGASMAQAAKSAEQSGGAITAGFQQLGSGFGGGGGGGPVDAIDETTESLDLMEALIDGAWGAAVIGALALLESFISSLFETEDATADAVDALRDQVREAEISRAAQERFKQTVEGASVALRDQSEALREQLLTAEQRRQQLIAEAQAIEANTRAAREAEAAQEAAAAASARRAREQGTMLGKVGYDAERMRPSGEAFGEGLWGAGNDELARRNVLVTQMLAIESQVEMLFDASRRAASDYEAALASLRWEHYQGNLTAEQFRTSLEGTRMVFEGLAGVAGAVTPAIERGRQLNEQARREAEQRAEQEQRERERAAQARADAIADIERETQAALNLAAAYNQGSAAALSTEAREAARAEALRLSINLTEHARRVHALMAAERLRDAGRIILRMDEERLAIERVQEALGEGWSWVDAENRTELERLLAPLIALGEETAEVAQQIRNLTSAFDDLTRARNIAAATRAIGQVRTETADLRDIGALAGRQDERIERARIEAGREVSGAGWKDVPAADRDAYIEAVAERERQRMANEAASYFAAEGRSLRDNIALLDQEAALLGVSRNERQKQLGLMALSLELNRRSGDEYEEQKRQVLALAAAEYDRQAALDRPLNRYMAELSEMSIGEQLEDTAVDAMRDLRNETAGAVAEMLGLHGAIGKVAERLIAMAMDQAIMQLLSALGGGGIGEKGGGGGGGLFGSLLNLLGGGMPGKPGGMGVTATGMKFASGGYMRIGGRGGIDNNELSLNGEPIAHVSRGETLHVVPQGRAVAAVPGMATPANQNGATAKVVLELSGDIDARIDQKATNVAVQVVRSAAPGIARTASDETLRRVSRPRING